MCKAVLTHRQIGQDSQFSGASRFLNVSKNGILKNIKCLQNEIFHHLRFHKKIVDKIVKKEKSYKN